MSCPPDSKLVVLTRAGDANASLAALLSERSIPHLSQPMLELVAVPTDAGSARCLADLDLIDDIIFVSPNAVRFAANLLDAWWPQWPAALRWYAVGEATARAMHKAFDILPIVPAIPTSEGLLALPDLEKVDDRRILIVRGRGGRALLAASLRERGARVDLLECYERRAVRPSLPVNRLLLSTAEAWFVIHSLDALDAMLTTWRWRSADVLIAVSERIAAVARERGVDNIVMAAGPYDNQVMEALGTVANWQ